jgi:sigma-B regulation protein RsbU (phosphoserine phosphatase)
VNFPGLLIGQLMLDAQLTIASADETFVVVFGAVPTGRPLVELVSERDRRGAMQLASKLESYRPGSIIDLQLLMTFPYGERHVRIRLLGAQGTFRAYIEPADDPTSLLYELARLRQRWATVFNRSEDGIALLSDTGALVEYNQRFAALMHLFESSSELLGRVLVDVLPTEFDPIRAALAFGQPEFHVAVTVGIDQLDVKGRVIADVATSTIETLLIVRDVTEERQIEVRDNMIRADLERAAKFQRTILGKPPTVPGLEFGVIYMPVETVGGDVYDASLLPDGTLRLFIADATGHGIEAALSTILIKNEYDSIKRHGSSPAAALRELNNRIANTHRHVEAMFSCVICDLDLARNKLRYANAGHPSALLARSGAVEPLEEDGALIGIKSGLRFPEWQLDLEAWESFVLVTDGIAETRDATGREFGDAGLYAAILEGRMRGREVAAEILTQVERYRGSAPRRDDITILAVSRTAVTPRS